MHSDKKTGEMIANDGEVMANSESVARIGDESALHEIATLGGEIGANPMAGVQDLTDTLISTGAS